MSQVKEAIDQRLVKALAHPLRVRILTVLNQRVASPRELSDEFDESIGNVSYHVRTLHELGCIELVKETPRRGAVEHHYRAVMRPVFSDADWTRIPQSVRRAISDAVLGEIWTDVAAAAKGGAFDAEDVHLSRTPVVLDKRGRAQLAKLLEDLVGKALKIQNESVARLQKAGEADSEAAELVLMLFDPSARARGRSRGGTKRSRASSGQ